MDPEGRRREGHYALVDRLDHREMDPEGHLPVKDRVVLLSQEGHLPLVRRLLPQRLRHNAGTKNQILSLDHHRLHRQTFLRRFLLLLVQILLRSC